MQDIYHGINAMMQGENLAGRPFEQNTKHDYVKALRQFLLWMVETGRSGILHDQVKKIRVPTRKFETTTPDALLTEDEVLMLIQGATSARDRALLSLTYETGARIGEISRLKWKDLTFDQDGIGVYITDEKTRKLRYARCTKSADYLVELRNSLVKKEGIDGQPVFMSNRKEAMEYGNLRKLLGTIAERAGLKKSVHWHLLRKSRITHMVKNHNIPESVLKKIFWGNTDTRMLRTYVVLSKHDIDEAILAASGIKQKRDESAKNAMKERLCTKCNHINTPTAEYCLRCRYPLSENALSQREIILKAIKEDPVGFVETVKEIVAEK